MCDLHLRIIILNKIMILPEHVLTVAPSTSELLKYLFLFFQTKFLCVRSVLTNFWVFLSSALIMFNLYIRKEILLYVSGYIQYIGDKSDTCGLPYQTYYFKNTNEKFA